MLRFRPTLAATLAGLCVSTPGLHAQTPASPTAPVVFVMPPAPEHADPEIVRYHALVNEHRRAIGCGPLQWNAPAARAAQEHADDMLKRDYLEHDTPEGLTEKDRISRAGGVYKGPVGEIILRATDAAHLALDYWIKSDSHRRILEKCRYTYHGVGRADLYWVEVFLAHPATYAPLPVRLPGLVAPGPPAAPRVTP